MNNLSKEKKQQLGMVAVITIVVVAVIWVGLISSQKNSLALMKKKTTELREKVEGAQKTIKQSETIRADLEQTSADLQLREETMASGDLYQWFLTKMIPATSTRSMNNFNANPPGLIDTRLIPQFPYKSAAYFVKVNGYYHDFGKFISDMEKEFPYGRIQNLDISPAPNQSEERLNFSFEFVTLYHTNRAVTVK